MRVQTSDTSGAISTALRLRRALLHDALERVHNSHTQRRRFLCKCVYVVCMFASHTHFARRYQVLIAFGLLQYTPAAENAHYVATRNVLTNYSGGHTFIIIIHLTKERQHRIRRVNVVCQALTVLYAIAFVFCWSWSTCRKASHNCYSDSFVCSDFETKNTQNINHNSASYIPRNSAYEQFNGK